MCIVYFLTESFDFMLKLKLLELTDIDFCLFVFSCWLFFGWW